MASLTKEQLEEIGQYIQANWSQWMLENGPVAPGQAGEFELRERMVRVEEELKHQRELMREGFERMDKRFESVDKRFESVDKRLDGLTRRMDRFMVWSFSLTVTMSGVVIAVLKWT